jgi:hypothetical protein
VSCVLAGWVDEGAQGAFLCVEGLGCCTLASGAGEGVLWGTVQCASRGGFQGLRLEVGAGVSKASVSRARAVSRTPASAAGEVGRAGRLRYSSAGLGLTSDSKTWQGGGAGLGFLRAWSCDLKDCAVSWHVVGSGHIHLRIHLYVLMSLL